LIVSTPAAFVALGVFALHLAANRGYGYFRDELYYLACADHLDFGYVDHPPLSIAVLWVVRGVLGDSLSALRLVPALCGALTVLLAGLMARKLGGGRFAQLLAALAVAIGPGHLAVTNFYSMNAIDLLVWAGAVYVFMSIVGGSTGLRYWVALGVVLGLGLENKVSVLWLGAGLAVALLVAQRRLLLTAGPWVAASVAALLFIPHVIWQMRHDWPTVEFVRNATGLKMTDVSPWQFFVDQLMAMHPLTLPMSLAGLWWLLRSGDGRPWRAMAWTFVIPLAILLASGTSRAYYLGPAYPIVFAAGAVAIARWTQDAAAMRLRPAIAGLLLAGGAATAPMVLPLLPVDRFVAYSAAIGITPRAEERGEAGPLPQYFADMFGWPEMVDEVANVYDALPPEERAKAVIYTDNYGRAAAVDFFGRARGLPRAVSGHNSYFLWGPRGGTGEVMILIGGDLEDHIGDFETVQPVTVVRCRYCMPYEDNVTIFVGRGMKIPLPELWPSVKRYI
jgi:hypothetical protein